MSDIYNTRFDTCTCPICGRKAIFDSFNGDIVCKKCGGIDAEKQRTLAKIKPRRGDRANTHHKMSIDVPNALFVKLAAMADDTGNGIGPIMCALAESALSPLGTMPQATKAEMEAEWKRAK